MDNKETHLLEIHDRIDDLIEKASRKLALMFPDHFDDIARQVIVDGKEIVQDSEILGWVEEIRNLEKISGEDNPWTILLNPEQHRNS